MKICEFKYTVSKTEKKEKWIEPGRHLPFSLTGWHPAKSYLKPKKKKENAARVVEEAGAEAVLIASENTCPASFMNPGVISRSKERSASRYIAQAVRSQQKVHH